MDTLVRAILKVKGTHTMKIWFRVFATLATGAAFVGCIPLAIWYTQIAGQGQELSAIQITQLYTQGAFFVLVAIALLVFALTCVVATRE